jgi:hypothetical protein
MTEIPRVRARGKCLERNALIRTEAPAVAADVERAVGSSSASERRVGGRIDSVRMSRACDAREHVRKDHASLSAMTIESGPTSGSTRVDENPASRIHS